MVGVTVHGRRGTIDWQIFRRLAVGSIPAALLTGMALQLFGRNSLGVDALIMQALGGMLVLAALSLFFKSQLHIFGKYFQIGDLGRFKHLQAPLTVIAGVFHGTVLTLISVGAGAIGTVILLYLYPMRLTSSKVLPMLFLLHSLQGSGIYCPEMLNTISCLPCS